MTEIKNFNVYNQRMSAAMVDKLFFMDKIDIDEVDTVIDFGCADGELLKLLPPQWDKIGVDNNPEMIRQARINCSDARYYSSLKDAVKHKTDKTLLIFSSVWHEIFHYCTKDEINEIYDEFSMHNNFKFIVIRDMCKFCMGDTPAKKEDIELIRNNPHGKLFDDFHQKFLGGRQLITENDLIHYLLKYRYEENWDRECTENYFSMKEEYFTRALLLFNYEIIYYERFVLPYIKETVLQDFNYKIKYPTHIKLIFRGVKEWKESDSNLMM